MATKWFYNANEALSFVLEARSDSELADLSDDTTTSNISQRIAEEHGEAMNEYAAVEDEEEEKESNKNIQYIMTIIMKSVIKMMRKKMQKGSGVKYQDTEGKLCQSKYIIFWGGNLAFLLTILTR